MQSRRIQIERRRLRSNHEIARRFTFPGETHADVVALHQRLKPGNTRQGNARLDHPELGAAIEEVFRTWIHGQNGSSTAEVLVHIDALDRTDLHAVEDDWSRSRTQAADIGHLEVHGYASLRRIEVLIQAEWLAWVGWWAVCIAIRGSKGDASGNDAGQRLGAQLQARQAAAQADATGIPEAGVFPHQVGVGLFDVDLHLDGLLVLGQLIALDLSNLDLLVVNRTTPL
ncbi:hypothetical protein D3C76_706290 [compost metagenome]